MVRAGVVLLLLALIAGCAAPASHATAAESSDASAPSAASADDPVVAPTSAAPASTALPPASSAPATTSKPPSAKPTSPSPKPAPTTAADPPQMGAAVDNPLPCQGEVVQLTVTLVSSTGMPMGGVNITSTWHYKSTDAYESAETNGGGMATIQRDIGQATPDYAVEIEVKTNGITPEGTATTSFTPQDC